jgi:hypothetical protein
VTVATDDLRTASSTFTNKLRKLVASPTISPNAITHFNATANSVTKGVDVTFTLTSITGVASVTLSRNYTPDPATATVLQTWTASLSPYTWADTDGALQTQGQAFYWITLAPQGIGGTSVLAGPQKIVLNPQLVPPVQPTSISASSGPLVNGTVKITVNVSGIIAAVKIYVSGYHSNPAELAVASSTATPLQLMLAATGETVTLEAVGVSAGGAETPTGPTTTITLNGTATIPATIQGMTVTQIAGGNQVNWPSSLDAGTTYTLYRAQRGQTFLLATMLATVTGSFGTLNYLDTAGLSGDWAYFVVATNGVGNSLPSPAVSPAILFSSASMPSNTSANTSNTATIDSIDSGTSVLIRIYGPGGVGTAYSRLTGFGTLARPNGTIAGLAYTTTYAILWTGTTYVVATTYPATLPDGYELVGAIITTAATGVVGAGATVTLVINTTGNVIQANPGALGSLYNSATVNISGGGGSGCQVTPNIVNGQITSYTVKNGGLGYATVPTGVVVGGASAGTSGGGGSTGSGSGSRTGCVEQGTIVEAPDGTTEELLPCDEWVFIDLGDGPLLMHPDTLVSVFKTAGELTTKDRIEIKGALWMKPEHVGREHRRGVKVKRTCPGGTYFAGPNMVRLHNFKFTG